MLHRLPCQEEIEFGGSVCYLCWGIADTALHIRVIVKFGVWLPAPVETPQ